MPAFTTNIQYCSGSLGRQEKKKAKHVYTEQKEKNETIVIRK